MSFLNVNLMAARIKKISWSDIVANMEAVPGRTEEIIGALKSPWLRDLFSDTDVGHSFKIEGTKVKSEVFVLSFCLMLTKILAIQSRHYICNDFCYWLRCWWDCFICHWLRCWWDINIISIGTFKTVQLEKFEYAIFRISVICVLHMYTVFEIEFSPVAQNR